MRPPTPTCSDCGGRIKKSRAKRCRPCYLRHNQGPRSRPRTVCEDCGAPCRGTLCIKCQHATYSASEAELTGGRWITVRGVRRWLSVETEIAQYAARREPRRPHAPGLDCCCCTGDLSRGLARRTVEGWAHAEGCAA